MKTRPVHLIEFFEGLYENTLFPEEASDFKQAMEEAFFSGYDQGCEDTLAQEDLAIEGRVSSMRRSKPQKSRW